MKLNKTEKKTKLDADINSAKRELKHVSNMLSGAKDEVATLVTLKEKNEKMIKEQDRHLTDTLNEIAQARLDWSKEKQKEQDDIDSKKKDVQAVLDRKDELDKQEREIEKKIEKNTDVLNEKKRLELSIKADKTALNYEIKSLETRSYDLDAREKEIDKKISDFKAKAKSLIDDLIE